MMILAVFAFLVSVGVCLALMVSGRERARLYGRDKPTNFEGRWNLHRSDAWRAVIERDSEEEIQGDDEEDEDDECGERSGERPA